MPSGIEFSVGSRVLVCVLLPIVILTSPPTFKSTFGLLDSPLAKTLTSIDPTLYSSPTFILLTDISDLPLKSITDQSVETFPLSSFADAPIDHFENL